MREPNPLFVDLQPPAGGLQRLQHSLTRHQTVAGNRWLRFVSGGALAASLLVLASLLPGTIARQQQISALRSALQAAVAPPRIGIRVTHGAAIELANGNPDVRVYLVQSASVPSRHDGTSNEP